MQSNLPTPLNEVHSGDRMPDLVGKNNLTDQSVLNKQSSEILLNSLDMIFFANLSQLLCIFGFCDRYFENHWLAVRNERALIARQHSQE